MLKSNSVHKAFFFLLLIGYTDDSGAVLRYKLKSSQKYSSAKFKNEQIIRLHSSKGSPFWTNLPGTGVVKTSLINLKNKQNMSLVDECNEEDCPIPVIVRVVETELDIITVYLSN